MSGVESVVFVSSDLKRLNFVRDNWINLELNRMGISSHSVVKCLKHDRPPYFPCPALIIDIDVVSYAYDLSYFVKYSNQRNCVGLSYSKKGFCVPNQDNILIKRDPSLWIDGYSLSGLYLLSESVNFDFDTFKDLLSRLSEGLLNSSAFGIPISGISFDLYEPKQDRLPCLFLDRDGVIIEDTGYPIEEKDLKIIEGVIPLIRFANDKGVVVVVVSNQSGVARGMFSENKLLEFTDLLDLNLKNRGLMVNDWFNCPYHLEGNNAEYKGRSLLRKPNPGMILQAASSYHIDIGQSFMVGDKDSDNINLLGLKTMLLKGKYPLRDKGEELYLDHNEITKKLSSFF